MGNERMILSPGSLAGGWESLDGSPDFYIFRDPAGTTACWPTALTRSTGGEVSRSTG
ncbi:hypothetical protein [Parabacteroides johnsonii]|uniref:hypothetical protein n=1 Tax=Parabacteroides johnsonii TaxID=387661 RepID=UPI00241FB5BC|nr:hypothetical protein [Parabacteroides johnsonii]